MPNTHKQLGIKYRTVLVKQLYFNSKPALIFHEAI